MKIRADRRVGLLLGGAILSTLVALGATVALPASDPSLDVDETKLDADALRGRDIVKREGLWQCEGFARETMADGEGAVTAEDIAGQNPVMLGQEFVGDLGTSCNVKLSEEDAAAVDSFLAARSNP